MEYSHLTFDLHKRVAFITLNRPEKRNAFNAGLVGDLSDSFNRAEKSGEVRVVVLRANGSAFSAGADLDYLRELMENDYERNLADSQQLMRLLLQMYKLKKPVIAQVQGPALAGGCGLATACDIIVASDRAEFGYPEARIGFVAALVMTFLVRRIGEGRTRELLLTGRTISASRAAEIGLVNELVPQDGLAERVETIASEISGSVSGSSIAITKDTLVKISGMDVAAALDYTAKINAATRMTEDCRKGVNAFLSKVEHTW